MKYLVLIIFCIALATGCNRDRKWIISPPAGEAFTGIHRDGITVLPNGRLLTPRGVQITVAPHPYGLALSNDGNIAVTANSGISPFSISIIRNLRGENPQVLQIPEGPLTNEGVLSAVFMGLAFSPDNKLIYVAGGQDNKVYIFNTENGQRIGVIICAGKDDRRDYTDGYLGDMKITKDGRYLYVVDQINFCINIIDTKTSKLIKRIDTGRYPFGVCFSPDEKRCYVANVGMFTYRLIESLDSKRLKETSLPFPAYAFGSKEAREGIFNDTMKVPGLGDPNVPESFSVWSYNIEQPAEPKLNAKIKTGVLVGQMVEGVPAVGGASPNSVVAADRYVFVSNGNNDCISVIDIARDTVAQTLYLQPDKRLRNLRGIIPFGLAVSPDQKRVYVAESGINAVGVIDVPGLKVLGHIPAGWFPSKLQVTSDGKKLIVANAKGFGAGPNGGKGTNYRGHLAYIGYIMKGTVSIMDIPSDRELDQLSNEVIANNFHFAKASSKAFHHRKSNPIPLYSGEKKSPIKHIVFISKENRTYDEVFGQIKKGNGDPSLARYGMGASFRNNSGKDSVANANIMVNHLKLARTYSISDNYYVDSDVSADGHRWLTCTYPNEWVETSTPAAYGGKRNLNLKSKSPGIFAFIGSSGSYFPEDYNEAGSMWDNFDRYGINYFNFGFTIEMAPSYADSTMKYSGIRYMINYPLPASVNSHTSRKVATFNLAIPDQFRVDMFIKEFSEKWLGNGKQMPQVITFQIPNDHGAGERPWAGYPFRESYMCDNDLAVGRAIEFLSHTPYWKEMAVFITEDDAQDGRDHIDAHRSVLMVISPWAKKDYVSHVHTSFGSIFKTFWNILGISYLNQFDTGANDLADMFTDKPDYTPYTAIPVDKRVFDPQKALDPFDAHFDWKAISESPKLDNPDDMMKDEEEEEE